MPNAEQLALLRQGVAAWNRWRTKHRAETIDLSGGHLTRVDLTKADLRGADLTRARLSGAHLSGAYLGGADLTKARLSGAHLRGAHLSTAVLNEAVLIDADLYQVSLVRAHLKGADLHGADLREAYLCEAHLAGTNLRGVGLTLADLRGADLRGADLRDADLHKADLRGANLEAANLERAVLIGTNFEQANLTGCRIHGVSVWDVTLGNTQQADLIITPEDQPTITVDNLEVAQFVYLLLNNENVRNVINTLGRKAVLILGRFTPEPRKQVLSALRNALRDKGYLPIVFDFERPTDRDFTETIKTLAGLCLFVIVDVTDPRSTPLELQATVPDYMLPFVPILQKGEEAFAMLSDLLKYPWVHKPVLAYESADQLFARLDTAIVRPALKLHKEMLQQRVQALPIQDISELPADQ